MKAKGRKLMLKKFRGVTINLHILMKKSLKLIKGLIKKITAKENYKFLQIPQNNHLGSQIHKSM